MSSPAGVPVPAREGTSLLNSGVSVPKQHTWSGRPALPVFWPAMLGTGLASLLVVGGLTLAVQTMKRSAAPSVPAESASEKAPATEKSGPPSKVTAIIPDQAGMAQKAAPVPKTDSPVTQVAEKKPAQPPPPDPEPEPVIALDEPPTEHVIEAQACDTCGTSIKFMRSPQAAGRRAAQEEKLVLLLHVSGNFEDSGFT